MNDNAKGTQTQMDFIRYGLSVDKQNAEKGRWWTSIVIQIGYGRLNQLNRKVVVTHVYQENNNSAAVGPIHLEFV